MMKAEAEGQDDAGRRFGWEKRLVSVSPFNLGWTALLVAVLVYSSFLACATLSGVPVIVEREGNPVLDSDAWTALCMAFLWSSILCLGEYTRRSNLAEARSLIALGVPVNTGRLKTLEFGPRPAENRRAFLFGLAGAIGGLVFYTQVYHPDGHPLRLSTITVTNIWFLVMTVVLFSRIFRSLSFARTDTAAFIRDLDHRVTIDLFDIQKLDGLGRIALRGALPWLVTGTIVLLLLLGQRSTELFVPLVIGLASSATIIFALPMLRVHRLIDAAKRAELVRLRREVGEAREIFEKRGGDADRAAIRLAALIAIETRVERAREWPLDLPTITRFVIYLALPLGSWLGGAIVERIVDLLF